MKKWPFKRHPGWIFAAALAVASFAGSWWTPFSWL
jgi:hypothetical protein